MANDQNQLPTVDLVKLRKDLQTIMDELDSTASNLDAYSPYMWRRLQTTADKVATAINAVRLHLTGMTAGDIAAQPWWHARHRDASDRRVRTPADRRPAHCSPQGGARDHAGSP